MKNGTFYVRLTWILFGQLLEIRLLFTKKSGNTGRVVRKKTVLETFPKHFIIDSIAVKADDDDDDDDAARAN